MEQGPSAGGGAGSPPLRGFVGHLRGRDPHGQGGAHAQVAGGLPRPRQLKQHRPHRRHPIVGGLHGHGHHAQLRSPGGRGVAGRQLHGVVQPQHRPRQPPPPVVDRRHEVVPRAPKPEPEPVQPHPKVVVPAAPTSVIGLHQHQHLGEGAGGHALHLPLTQLPGAPRVKCLLHLPQHHAQGQEEEEAGEEDGEEDEEVDVGLVLTEVQDAIGFVLELGVRAALLLGGGALPTLHDDVEAGDTQVVVLLGQGDDEAELHVAHHQDGVLLADGDVGVQAAGRDVLKAVLPKRRDVTRATSLAGAGLHRGQAVDVHLDREQSVQNSYSTHTHTHSLAPVRLLAT